MENEVEDDGGNGGDGGLDGRKGIGRQLVVELAHRSSSCLCPSLQPPPLLSAVVICVCEVKSGVGDQSVVLPLRVHVR